MIKILYWLSFVLCIPLLAIGAIISAIADAFTWVGSFIHDHTMHPLWKILHERKLK